MTLKIDDVDFINTPSGKSFVAYGGLKWSRNDVDSPNTGRAMNALMYRGRVATKMRLDITCRPLDGDEIKTVLTTILPEFVTVKYDDPLYGTVTKTMYSNNIPATYLMQTDGGKEYWNGVTFPLIER